MADDFTFTSTDDSTPVKVTGNKERWDKTIWNISRKDIDKVKSIVDKVEISQVGKSTIIEINLKKLKIVIDS